MAQRSLSVVVATFDGESWIAEQLLSIAQQTRPPDEIIVSDDGSSDRTVEIVREFSSSCSIPLRVVRGPSLGPAENFWFASSLCSSDLIAWSDQDDWWLPRKLEISEKALIESGATVVSHSAIVVDEHLKPTGERFPNYRSTTVLDPLVGDPWHVPPGFSILFRREFLSGIDWARRPDSHQTGERGNHDHTLAIVSFATSKRIQIAEPLAYYRRHSQNWTATSFWKMGVRESVHIGEPQYRALAEIARENLSFISTSGASSPEIVQYYNALAMRCEKRADVYASSRLIPGVHALGIAVFSGVYGSRKNGRFRLLAGLKDFVEVVMRWRAFGSSLHRSD